MFKYFWSMTMVIALALTGLFSPVSYANGAVHEDPVLGVQLELPSGASVVRQGYVADEFGFTIVKPTRPDVEERHGESFLMRVVWIRNAAPSDLDKYVAQTLAAFPNLPIQTTPVSIGKQSGTALYPLPGQYYETIYMYVAANSRLYKIVYGRGQLDPQGQALLASIRFQPPTRSLESLGLPSEEESLRPPLPPDKPAPPPGKGAADPNSSLAHTPHESTDELIEPMAATNCVNWPTSKFLQTPFDYQANGNGWSQAGPNFYGEGGHIRCNSTTYLNDHHAIDFPLRKWDNVWAPSEGKVIYAGWARDGWQSAGRIVVIDLGGGYWSSAFHLAYINVSVGQNVTRDSIIAYAGGSGYGADDYWLPHLHQGLYLNAQLYAPSGDIYGGQSTEPRNIYYFRNGGGTYPYFTRYQSVSY